MMHLSNGNGFDQCGSSEKWGVYGYILYIKSQITHGLYAKGLRVSITLRRFTWNGRHGVSIT